MRDLKAVKPLTYGTRRLLPGDTFTARTERDAKVLVAIGKAKRDRAKTEPANVDDMKALRAEYLTLTGKKPFGGWGANELRERIAAAKAGT